MQFPVVALERLTKQAERATARLSVGENWQLPHAAADEVIDPSCDLGTWRTGHPVLSRRCLWVRPQDKSACDVSWCVARARLFYVTACDVTTSCRMSNKMFRRTSLDERQEALR